MIAQVKDILSSVSENDIPIDMRLLLGGSKLKLLSQRKITASVAQFLKNTDKLPLL
jgi:hypothetical protein